MVNEYYSKNKERILLKRKEYREKNRDIIALKKKQDRLDKIEQYKENDRENYEKNKDRYKENARRFYQMNKEKILNKHKENRTEISKKANEMDNSNPERRKKTIIRATLNKEFERGNVEKKECSKCHTTDNLNFHHEDYNTKEYKVLCKKCHLEEHEKIGYKLPIKMESIFN